MSTRPKFDEYAADYDSLHEKSVAASGESVVYFADYKVACLRRYGVLPDDPVLDYGCGVGNVTARLTNVFKTVHAYDPSPKSLEVARAHASAASFHEHIEQVPDSRFACAVLSGVLHHVAPDERARLLHEVRGKLAPGGRLFVFEHNPLNPATRHAVATCPFDDDAILLWPREIKRLLRATGFAEVRLDYIVFFPHFLSWLRPLEPHLRRLVLGAQTLTVGQRGT